MAILTMRSGDFTMIIGIGIDDAVHLVSRHFLSRNQSIEGILEEIAPILTLTTLSTMIGFGALAFSSYPFFRNLGIIIAFGVFSSWIFTMVLLPPLLKFMFKKQPRSD